MTNTLGAMAGLAVAVLFGKWVPLATCPNAASIMNTLARCIVW